MSTFLVSLQSITSTFGDKLDVVPKHWKTHVSEERLDISSEPDCSGLAQLEEWHYSVFDSSGTCFLGEGLKAFLSLSFPTHFQL